MATQQVCGTCSKNASEVKLQKCSGCNETYYCNKDCQKADWKNHKKACGSKPSIPVTPELGMRLPGIIEIGPVMTVGEVLAAKLGDPPVQYKERLYQPTPAEVHKRCSELLKKSKGGKKKEELSKQDEHAFKPGNLAEESME